MAFLMLLFCLSTHIIPALYSTIHAFTSILFANTLKLKSRILTKVSFLLKRKRNFTEFVRVLVYMTPSTEK